MEGGMTIKGKTLADYLIDAGRLAQFMVDSRPGFFKTIILDDWRGIRFIFDSDASRNCDRQCHRCVHTKLFKKGGEFSFEEIKTDLYRFTKQIDIDLYVGERGEIYLPCKTLKTFTDCYSNCLIRDPQLKTFAHFVEEVQLVKNFLVIWAEDINDIQALGNQLRKQIIDRARRKISDERKPKLLKALDTVGWNLRTEEFE